LPPPLLSSSCLSPLSSVINLLANSSLCHPATFHRSHLSSSCLTPLQSVIQLLLLSKRLLFTDFFCHQAAFHLLIFHPAAFHHFRVPLSCLSLFSSLIKLLTISKSRRLAKKVWNKANQTHYRINVRYAHYLNFGSFGIDKGRHFVPLPSDCLLFYHSCLFAIVSLVIPPLLVFYPPSCMYFLSIHLLLVFLSSVIQLLFVIRAFIMHLLMLVIPLFVMQLLLPNPAAFYYSVIYMFVTSLPSVNELLVTS
jgi:hypothetical protein